ncbi:hypothetical protein [Streptomyces lonarensis]|uniref:Uncharacterized protein n=1 Tax=Streptomyces lonarensis TaxID=700599 RepID=A0A7X6CXF8_9ACTN|nr:hypothetical protein [Streptomyces lonarensis]NJQ04308.1 hypothetical protein [Streptomyces lonarensis]
MWRTGDPSLPAFERRADLATSTRRLETRPPGIIGEHHKAPELGWWLEDRARSMGPGWYPYAAAGDRLGGEGAAPVPSWEAGMADEVYTQQQVLELLRGAGVSLHPHELSAAIAARLLPGPMRTAHGHKHWDPKRVEDAVDVEPRVITLRDLAEERGESYETVRKAVRRLEIPASRRQPGRGGMDLYPYIRTVVALRLRPGIGTRTDLKETPK